MHSNNRNYTKNKEYKERVYSIVTEQFVIDG